VRVLHVITGLGVGGAESMLVKLLGTMDRARFEPVVLSLMPGGTNRAALEGLGVAVHDAGMRRGLPGPGTLGRLAGLARGIAPDLVQGWMYHGNLAADWVRRRSPADPAMVWNIRHSLHDIRREKPLTRAVIRLGARLCGHARAVVCNSQVALEQHAAAGYDRTRLVMIPNGFDLDRFGPDPAARAAVRGDLGLGPDAVLVGMVARRHPMKGHADFLRMAAAVAPGRADVHFLLAGPDVVPGHRELDRLAGVPGLDGRVHLLGARADAPRLMAALDVLVVASLYGEGFPNVLGEAMACGVPCVTTDVGDAAAVAGPAGRVATPGDPAGLAAAVGGILDLPAAGRADLGRRGRERIRARYSLAAVARRYEELYDSCLEVRGPSPR